MSVINNVLKDLDTRESRFTPIEITAVTAAPRSRRDLRPAALALLPALLLGAVAWIYLQGSGAVVAATTSSSASETQLAAVAARPEDDLAVTTTAEQSPAGDETLYHGVGAEQMIGNQIVGLQIRESEQDMRLEFVLRDRVVAYLKQRGENSFGYHLRGIESQIAAPVISDNRWINALAISTSVEGVDIEFETAPEILVETRQTLVDGEPVWSINLRKSAPPPLAAPVDIATIAETTAAQTAASSGSLPEGPEPIVTEERPATTETTAKDERQAAVTPPVVKLEIKSTDPNAKSANQLDYAVELINSRRYTDAERLLKGLLEGGEDHGARQHLLALYSSQQQNERFSLLARESAKKYANDALFRTEYGRSLFQNKEYQALIQLFGSEAGLDSDQQSLVAASYQRLDEHLEAIRYYQLALKQDAGNAKNWIGLGISLEYSARLEAALESYQRAGRLGNLNSRLQAFVDKRSSALRRTLN